MSSRDETRARRERAVADWSLYQHYGSEPGFTVNRDIRRLDTILLGSTPCGRPCAGRSSASTDIPIFRRDGYGDLIDGPEFDIHTQRTRFVHISFWP